jgi:hypothetical protein
MEEGARSRRGSQQKKAGGSRGCSRQRPRGLWCQCFPSATPGSLCRNKKDAALGSQLKLGEARVLDCSREGCGHIPCCGGNFYAHWRLAAGSCHLLRPPRPFRLESGNPALSSHASASTLASSGRLAVPSRARFGPRPIQRQIDRIDKQLMSEQAMDQISMHP